MDGDDTNDGRAMDPSRACRTVGGAMKSHYYQPGTQIRVSPGHYFEDNPLPMKPYTSVMGSDIRTTEIEPINKTQDLFHVNSGCYLAFMQFCQGRSGLLPGDYYTANTNRGAYATAFPPQTGNDRIDLFHSPYIQNCTNLSGPWLKDGSLFQPNGTVQVPIAVGTATWVASATSILVTLNTSLSTGTVIRGMSVNQGQQNLGFFNARSLLLSNKPFLQSQVVKYVDATFNSGSFDYNNKRASCIRDIGLIVDSVALDLLYNSDSESIFAGLQYWNQSGYTGDIARELTTTTAAISYVKTAVNNLLTTINSGAASIVSADFQVILDILNNGITGITDLIVTNGEKSTNATIVSCYNALIAKKLEIAAQAVAYVTAPTPGGLGFTNFNTSTCYRDIQYMIDSVAFDLLHPNADGNPSNKQAIKSGAYYYNYDATSTAVPNEIPQVVAAYNYLRSILPNIITGTLLPKKYSLSSQLTADNGYVPATSYESGIIQDKIDLITNIIRNGPSVVSAKIPISLTQSGNIEYLNAYRLLEANITFLQDEVIAYIDSQFNNFDYNRQICYRDVGIIIENISYDATFGGNEKSIEAGLAYWDGAISKISGQVTQTISALDYLSALCKQVITNTPCTVLTNVVEGIKSGTQVINTALTDGGIAATSIGSLFNIITRIIQTGDGTEFTKQTSSAIDAAYLSAEVLMQANRTFIQEDTINWINNNFQTFPYNAIKCKRDISLIVDSAIEDLLFPTVEHSQSTFAGLQYYAQGDLVDSIPDQYSQTIQAVEYLKELSVKIIQNITPADDLVDRYFTPTVSIYQDTTLQPGTYAEAKKVMANYDIVLSILKGNIIGWSDKTIFGFDESKFLSVKNAYAVLQANSAYMAKEVVAYINATNPGYSTTYDNAKCERDVGYMNKSVCFDLLYGGNKQSIQAGLSYYRYIGTKSNIVGETTATIAAFTYLAAITSNIIQNISVTPLQKTVQQTITTYDSTVGVANLFTQAISTVTDIIANGTAIAATRIVPISLTKTTSTATLNGAGNIIANKDFIKAEVIAYIDQTYQVPKSFNYNSDKCKRDTLLIVDAIGKDLIYDSTSDSTFTGLQYWNQGTYTGQITSEIDATKYAINQLRLLARTYATNSLSTLNVLFGYITNILTNGVANISGSVSFGGFPTTDTNILADVAALQNPANILSMQDTIIGLLTINYPSLTYDQNKCRRDLGHIINAISSDLLTGGNIQSIKSGVYYYSYNSNSTAIPNEIPQTTIAYQFISSLMEEIITGQKINNVYQTIVKQVINLTPGTLNEAALLQEKLELITKIINTGPSSADDISPQKLSASSDSNIINTWQILNANRLFIQAEVIAYVEQTFRSGTSFKYNQELCYRDTGLIIDAVSQDIILGGNQKSIESGLAYWNQGYNYVTGQETTTTLAINHARDLALQIIANQPVTPQPQTESTQIINTFYDYGQDYMPQQAIRRNFGIITNIIENGPLYAPSIYPGSGLANTTGLNALDVLIAPLVTSIQLVNTATNTYLIGLDTLTVGFANNATLYFGDISIFPLQDYQVEALALEYTGSANTWDMRKVDPIGGMGGSLVDGAVISERSPINSFVYDAYTQLTQGGRGVRVTNNGYAQLVSVFTIFSSVGVQVDNGGIASIVNSNANFGDLCLVAKGYGTRKFSGTVYNPKLKAYPDSPGENGFNQYYPNGFWPNNARIEVFVPDLDNRPHISLVMEVVPEEGHINEQGFPGFLTAQPNLATLTTGSITISDIDTTGISVGNFVYIRDQFASTFDNFQYNHNQIGEYLDEEGNVTTDPNAFVTNSNYGIPYIATGTYVTSVGYKSVTLNFALPTGGGFPGNDNYFTFYFCGNAYYTVLSSTVANNPKLVNGLDNTNILAVPNVTTSQVNKHNATLQYLNNMIDSIIANVPVGQELFNETTVQTFLPQVVSGGNAKSFIDLRFGEMIAIIGADPIGGTTPYNTVVPPKLIKKTGTVPAGSGDAITLINANKTFMADQVIANIGVFDYDEVKCRRDVFLIIQQLIYDLESGGNYNSVYSGLSYWSRNGTHHIVQMGENVTRSDLFPDGATVNFYQRSYISASGYVFEYVGAGTNYGALPQFGVADPVQGKEVVQLDNGAVFFTSTDQNGDFRIGPGLVISQATGVLSGRTFTKSLFANMTPFILAIEGGGGF